MQTSFKTKPTFCIVFVGGHYEFSQLFGSAEMFQIF
jgi:hypothetical protein